MTAVFELSRTKTVMTVEVLKSAGSVVRLTVIEDLVCAGVPLTVGTVAESYTEDGDVWSRWSPSWPEESSPQHPSEPSVRTPQECADPPATCAQLVSVPIWRGVVWFLVAPSPSWLVSSRPQQIS